MAKRKEARVSFGLSDLAETFQLDINLLGQCATLNGWLNTTSNRSFSLKQTYILWHNQINILFCRLMPQNV